MMRDIVRLADEHYMRFGKRPEVLVLSQQAHDILILESGAHRDAERLVEVWGMRVVTDTLAPGVTAFVGAPTTFHLEQPGSAESP